jgi:two-component system LytT family sensor kinase
MDPKESAGRAPIEVSAPHHIGLDVAQEHRNWAGKRLARIQLASLIFLAWTAVGIFEAVPEMLKGFYWYVFANKIFDSWGWALLTPALLLIDRRFALRQTNIAGLVLFFLLLSIPVTLVHTYLVALLLYPIPQISWSPLRNTDFAVYYFLGGWVTYCAFVAVLQAFRFYNRSLTSQLQLERVEKSLIESRLNALRLHLEPHFLFNALNAISSEMVLRPHIAQDMVADLGALLRLSLDSKDSPEISLAQELTLLDHYVSIQKVRFGKRLDIKLEIDPDAVFAKVPSMLLQPLVENAIRHGVEGRRSGATITISASKSGDRLQLSVTDNGRGLPEGWKLESSAGHGLRVTLERLLALYPQCGAECLTVQRRAAGGTEVTVLLPFSPGGPDGTVA